MPAAVPPAATTGRFVVVVRLYIDANRDNVLGSGEGVSGVPVYVFDTTLHCVDAALTERGIAVFQVPLRPGALYYFDVPYLDMTAFVPSPKDAKAEEPKFIDFRLESKGNLPMMLP